MADLTYGFNITEANNLKEEVRTHLDTLAAKTDILADIEREVANTWRGPDADKYLDKLFNCYNEELVPVVKENFAKIEDTINELITNWISFQGQ